MNDPDVVSKARPKQSSVLTFPEPVDHEELWRLPQLASHVQPMLKVVSEVVAKEWSHGEGVMHHLGGSSHVTVGNFMRTAHLFAFMLRRGCSLRLDRGSHEDTMWP